MFLVDVVITDKEKAGAVMPGHLAFLQEHNRADEILFYGPTAVGGLMVLAAESKAQLETLLQQDPLYVAKLGVYQVKEFTFASKKLEIIND